MFDDYQLVWTGDNRIAVGPKGRAERFSGATAGH